MKKRLYFPLCAVLALALALPVCAVKTGEVVNHALYTDIVAQIDGHPLRSYNVDGHTAVVAEDLRSYGFYSLWDPEERTLRVERATGSSGQPEMPETWPEYTPEPLEHPIGSQAQAILSTDIAAYVAGEWVESFNIGGETLIWFSDLAPYGAVEYDGESRTANLTLGDPMQLRLDGLIKGIEDWRALGGSQSSYELYSNEYGTLFVGYQTGTSHGTACQMVFVQNNGTAVDVIGLLPACGFGPAYYAHPRDIQLSGSKLTFITPVEETTDWAAGTSKAWGDTLCQINLAAGAVESMQPLAQPLTEWTACLASEDGEPSGQMLELTVTREGAQVKAAAQQVPGRGLQISISPKGLSINNTAPELESEEGLRNTAYYQAFALLNQLSLPRVTQEDFSPGNTQEQRAHAAQYFQVTLNGQPVSGDLWWGQGNNHVDLHFDFDAPVYLADSDVLRIWMGLPAPN